MLPNACISSGSILITNGLKSRSNLAIGVILLYLNKYECAPLLR